MTQDVVQVKVVGSIKQTLLGVIANLPEDAIVSAFCVEGVGTERELIAVVTRR